MTEPDDQECVAPWWVISGPAFLDALRRAHDGEDPDLLYAEHYANSDQGEGS